MKKAKPIVIHLDELCRACGYFNPDTNVNNGYGCDAPDNQEAELVKINGETERFKKRLHYQVEIAALRREYGSIAQIRQSLETAEGQAFLLDIRQNKVYDKDFVAKFGCKLQGKCYSFSCPIANECDLEDLKEHDSDYYEEWEGSEPNECGADLMLVDDADLQIKLGYVPDKEISNPDARLHVQPRND